MISVSGPCIYFILKICQFHEFFYSNFWPVFFFVTTTFGVLEELGKETELSETAAGLYTLASSTAATVPSSYATLPPSAAAALLNLVDKAKKKTEAVMSRSSSSAPAASFQPRCTMPVFHFVDFTSFGMRLVCSKIFLLFCVIFYESFISNERSLIFLDLPGYFKGGLFSEDILLPVRSSIRLTK